MAEEPDASHKSVVWIEYVMAVDAVENLDRRRHANMNGRWHLRNWI
jgi:hypothetical protein